jgi:hypothetical protein
MCHVRAESLGLASGDNAAFAVHDGDAAYFTGV